MVRLTASILVLTAALALGAPGATAQNGRPPVSVVVADAVELALAPTIQVPGTVISRSDAAISADVAGRVTAIAEVGTRIEAGGLIAELDSERQALDVEQNEAIVGRLETQLGFLTREVARYEELAARNNTPARSVDEAISQRDIANHELRQARIELERARINLARTSVRAPFEGQIADRRVELGEYVNIGEEVARLVDTSGVEVRALVPVSAAPFVEEGRTLTLTGPAAVFDARVSRAVRVGDEVTRTFEIRLDVPSEAWVVGTPVRVAVPTDTQRLVTAVPRDALVLRSSGTAVFRLTEDGTAERIAVETGTGSGTMIEVRGAIQPGDRVIVRGAERLSGGDAVAVIGPS